LRFFFDNCISPRYTRALRVLAEVQKYELLHLAEKFDREDIKDEDWIRALGEEGDWVIISGDPRITKGKAEKRAWRESGLTGFFFGKGWSSRSYWKQAEDIVRWWPKIVLEARKTEPGTGYIIPVGGKEFRIIYES
jgi:hypothetical protein